MKDHHEMDWDELDLEYARKRGKAAEAKVKELEKNKANSELVISNLMKLTQHYGQACNRLAALLKHLTGIKHDDLPYKMIWCKCSQTGAFGYQQVFCETGPPEGWEMQIAEDEIIWWPGNVESWPLMWRERYVRNVSKEYVSICGVTCGLSEEEAARLIGVSSVVK